MSATNNQTALVGTEYILKCSGVNLTISDIVWLYYPTGNSSYTNIIYSDGDYTHRPETKYEVKSIPTSANTIITNLMIKNVTLEDSLFTYQCACNVYKEACSSGSVLVAEANLIAMTTTTTTTTTTSKAYYYLTKKKEKVFQHSVSLITATTTTTSTTSTTTEEAPSPVDASNHFQHQNRSIPKMVRPEPSKTSFCISDSYNNTEHTLLLISLTILVVAALLFHISFHGFLKKTKLMFFFIFIAIFCIMFSVLFWIYPSCKIN